MPCHYFAAKQCLSCQWLTKPYAQQLADKQNHFEQQLADYHPETIYPITASDEWHFRNKAKMVVTGTVEKPILGIINHNQERIDLCDCPLYSPEFQQALSKIKDYIQAVGQNIGLVPYNIKRKKGELKFVILTHHQQRFMLRFVLRSADKVEQIRATLPLLRQYLPELAVISVNIQPKHAAVLEGEQEIILSELAALPVQLNHVPLYIRPQSFFQTNSQIAEKLYATAAAWVDEINSQPAIPAINSIWDLFCGVGGFGLHCAKPDTQLTGIEINAEAIACAKASAEQLQLTQVSFSALDSTKFALDQADIPDLVLVNPPRRGIGQALAEYLQQVSPSYILYSSCNPETLMRDLAVLNNYTVTKAQLFDMFPHTEHVEAMVLLKQK